MQEGRECTSPIVIGTTVSSKSKEPGGGCGLRVGSGKLIDPSKFTHVFVSPRQHAQRALKMLPGDAHKDALVKEGMKQSGKFVISRCIPSHSRISIDQDQHVGNL